MFVMGVYFLPVFFAFLSSRLSSAFGVCSYNKYNLMSALKLVQVRVYEKLER